MASGLGQRNADDEVVAEPEFGHARLEARQPLGMGGVEISARQEGDSPVPQRIEVPHGLLHAAEIVGAGIVAAGVRDRAQCLDERQSPLPGALRQVPVGSGRGADDQAVDAVLAHAADDRLLLVARVLAVGEHDHHVGRVQRQFDAGQHVGEEGIAQIGDDDADGVASLGPHARGAEIVDIAEALEHLLDARARLLADQRALADDERCRGARDARFLRDVLKGDPVSLFAARSHRSSPFVAEFIDRSNSDFHHNRAAACGAASCSGPPAGRFRTRRGGSSAGGARSGTRRRSCRC